MRDKFVPMKVLDGSTHQSYIAPATAQRLYIPKQAGSIMWQAVTQNVRYSLDGTTPTASTGFQLKAGEPPVILELSSKMDIMVVRESAGAVLEHEFGEA